jgi:hypothetical protein
MNLLKKKETFENNNIINYIDYIFNKELKTKEGFSVLNHMDNIFNKNKEHFTLKKYLNDLLNNNISKEGFELNTYLNNLYKKNIKTKEGFKIIELLNKNYDVYKKYDNCNNLKKYLKIMYREQQEKNIKKIYIKKILLFMLLSIFMFILIKKFNLNKS